MKLPKTQTAFAVAAALSLAGIAAASAAGMPSPALVPNAGATAKMAPPASDSLSLSAPQQHAAWNDLYVRSLNQETPAGFDATVGAVVPDSVSVAPVTIKAASDVLVLIAKDVEGADRTPTPAQREAAGGAAAAIDRCLTAWDRLRGGALPAINAKLGARGLATIEVPAAAHLKAPAPDEGADLP